MTNSALADMITATQGQFNKTRVEYAELLHHQTEPHKLPRIEGTFSLRNKEGRK